jgi:hypothetical protein
MEPMAPVYGKVDVSSMTDRQRAIVNALVQLNWHYGKGDITAVSFTINRVYRSMPDAGSDSCKFRIRGNSVFAFRRRRKFTDN